MSDLTETELELANARRSLFAVTQAALRASKGLGVCDLDHGGDANPARVYGHHASPRTCIRIKATNEWVYDPAWEKNND